MLLIVTHTTLFTWPVTNLPDQYNDVVFQGKPQPYKTVSARAMVDTTILKYGYAADTILMKLVDELHNS